MQKRSSSSRLSLTSRQYLENLDEGELFMELIRDISNELDINVLCHKILVNVCLLTHADRGSLFLAKGTSKNRYLVAKLFDVNQDTGKLLIVCRVTNWHDVLLFDRLSRITERACLPPIHQSN